MPHLYASHRACRRHQYNSPYHLSTAANQRFLHHRPDRNTRTLSIQLKAALMDLWCMRSACIEWQWQMTTHLRMEINMRQQSNIISTQITTHSTVPINRRARSDFRARRSLAALHTVLAR